MVLHHALGILFSNQRTHSFVLGFYWRNSKEVSKKLNLISIYFVTMAVLQSASWVRMQSNTCCYLEICAIQCLSIFSWKIKIKILFENLFSRKKDCILPKFKTTLFTFLYFIHFSCLCWVSAGMEIDNNLLWFYALHFLYIHRSEYHVDWKLVKIANK